MTRKKVGKDVRVVRAIGIELEGAWDDAPCNMKDDSSVNSSLGASGGTVGECISRPFTKLSNALAWMTTNYPNRVDGSCGLHVHVSTLAAGYTGLLAEPAFNKFFLWRMMRWGKAAQVPATHAFWSRLAGNNRYCKAAFQPNEQLNTGNRGLRYTQINFCAYKKYGTVEFRMLPMFEDKELSCGAVAALHATVEDYLRAALRHGLLAKPTKPIDAKVKVDESLFLEVCEVQRRAVPSYDEETAAASTTPF